MKKIFAFDMDGTILDSHDKMKPATVEALKALKELGHYLVIATGRPFFDVSRSLKEHFHLFNEIICNNGSYTIDVKNNEPNRIHAVPHPVMLEAIKIGQDHNCFMAIHGDFEAQRAYLGENISADWDHNHFQEFSKFKDTFLPHEEVLEWAKTQHVSQFSLRSTPEVIAKVKPLFDKFSIEVDIHIANTFYLDVNPKGVSKWAALLKLSEKFNVKIEDIVTFGDSGNDLQMLKNAGLGICMGNGSEDAKANADEVIGDNDSNAIAHKIQEMIN